MMVALGATIDSFEIESLARQWIEFCRTPEKTPEWWDRRESYVELWDLCSDDPDDAWQVILEIVRSESDSELLAELAAGPLEVILSEHGSYIIERVETEAQRDPKFRETLAGTWKLFMTDEIWLRVLRASKRNPRDYKWMT